MAQLLRSCGVSRAHIHHLMGMDLDVRKLLHRLEVPFDVTVHDYFALCPQVNLLPWRQAHYCGEPGPAACNACIADTPSHSARDILAWRAQFAWLFLEAERVICPSEDARARLARYGLADRAVVVPHEPVAAAPWPLQPPRLRGGKLRVALLGVLAPQKGAHTVLSLLEAADPAQLEFHLIGYSEDDLPEQRDRAPHGARQVRGPRTAGPAGQAEAACGLVPGAVAGDLQLHADRRDRRRPADRRHAHRRVSGTAATAGRCPGCWIRVPSAAEWLAVFEAVRGALRLPVPRARPMRAAIPAFYPAEYLRPALQAPALSPRTIDLRRPGRTSIVVVPERFDTGALTPCAYIRLLLPLDHPAIGGDCDIVLADVEAAQRYRADIIAIQRYAVPGLAAADALTAHCRSTGATLLYDMDDDLLHVPPSHADAAELRPKAKLVQRLLRAADVVWVSTAALAARIAAVRPDARVVPNGLDERLWCGQPPAAGTRQGPVRILCMGTATHDADFAIIEPALARLKVEFGNHVEIDMLGVTTRPDLPDWVNRPGMPVTASGSYPGFVNWLTQQPGWDIGLAPLADTAFNRCKSSIKTLDYAALGAVVLASELDVYRGSVADGPGGMLVPNRAEAWYAALSRLLRDRTLRRQLGRAALDEFTAVGTLASQAEQRRAAVQAVLRVEAPVTRSRRNGQRAAAA